MKGRKIKTSRRTFITSHEATAFHAITCNRYLMKRLRERGREIRIKGKRRSNNNYTMAKEKQGLRRRERQPFTSEEFNSP